MMRFSGNLAFIWRTTQAESRRIEDEASIIFENFNLGTKIHSTGLMIT